MWCSAVGCIATLILSLLVMPYTSQAQRPTTIPRVGFIHPTSAAAGGGYILDAFRQGLHDLGYVEGETITLEVRWAEGLADRLPDLIADLLRLKVDALVVSAAAGALAAKQAGLTTPVVFAAVTDPVGRGLIDTLARPGGHLTGTALALGEGFAGKWVELLKEAVPQVARVAVLRNPTHPVAEAFLRETQAAGQALGVKLRLFEARDHRELEHALVRMEQDDVEALLVTPDPLFGFHRRRLVEFAARHRWPAMFYNREFVEAGGLMAYGPNFPVSFRRAAYYVDRILKGSKPADLPVEQPTKFELVVNLKTAKALGITMPPSLLLLADEVIQ
jgi:putative tryptophan/tyrosine transport system substrate-binding protein